MGRFSSADSHTRRGYLPRVWGALQIAAPRQKGAARQDARQKNLCQGAGTKGENKKEMTSFYAIVYYLFFILMKSS